MLDRSKQPQIHEIPFPNILPLEKRVLSNGVEMYILRGGTQEIVEVDIITRSGVLYAERGGVARSTSTLLGEGAGNYTAKQIASKFDFYGVMVSASVGMETSEFTVVSMTKYLDKCLDEIEAMFKAPVFQQLELDLHKEKILHKHKMQMQKTKYRAARLARTSLYDAESRYSRLMSAADIESISREALLDFHSKCYTPDGAKIFISGLPTEEFLQRLERIFGDTWQYKPLAEVELRPKYKQEVQVIFDEYEEAMQNTIHMTTKMPTIDNSDIVYLDVLNMIYGGYFGSRLMKNIREEKGLTYGINSCNTVNHLDGYHTICSNVKSDMYEVVLDEIWKEMELLRREPISVEELDLVKSYMYGCFTERMDNILSMGDIHKGLILIGKDYDYYRNYYDAISSATPEDILRVAQKYYIRDNYHVIVSGKR